ncbi:hypothetical protein KUCAC02_035135, partial [Chaenocephalus aceratus]
GEDTPSEREIICCKHLTGSVATGRVCGAGSNPLGMRRPTHTRMELGHGSAGLRQ